MYDVLGWSLRVLTDYIEVRLEACQILSGGFDFGFAEERLLDLILPQCSKHGLWPGKKYYRRPRQDSAWSFECILMQIRDCNASQRAAKPVTTNRKCCLWVIDYLSLLFPRTTNASSVVPSAPVSLRFSSV